MQKNMQKLKMSTFPMFVHCLISDIRHWPIIIVNAHAIIFPLFHLSIMFNVCKICHCHVCGFDAHTNIPRGQYQGEAV